MLTLIKKTLFLFLFGGMLSIASAKPSNANSISLDFPELSLKEAITILAKCLHRQVIISPTVQGMTSLQFDNITAKDAFNTFLALHHLAEWQGFIGYDAEILERKQSLLKLAASLEETEPIVMRLWHIHYANPETLKNLLQEKISKRGFMKMDVRTNILYAEDTSKRLKEIDRLIKHFDIPVKQLLIEAHLASVDHDFQRELGIQYGWEMQNAGDFTLFTLPNSQKMMARLSALEKEGHGEIISSPRLFTSNQQTASIESGEEIPYQEISRSGATGVAFKKAVLSLKVTPQILPNDQILLQLQVNQDKPSKRMVLGVPAITTRQMSTQVLVKNGQTIVLGGVIEADHAVDQERIPFLSKIPLVGLLFRQQNVTTSKRELLIVVTPKMIT